VVGGECPFVLAGQGEVDAAGAFVVAGFAPEEAGFAGAADAFADGFDEGEAGGGFAGVDAAGLGAPPATANHGELPSRWLRSVRRWPRCCPGG